MKKLNNTLKGQSSKFKEFVGLYEALNNSHEDLKIEHEVVQNRDMNALVNQVVTEKNQLANLLTSFQTRFTLENNPNNLNNPPHFPIYINN